VDDGIHRKVQMRLSGIVRIAHLCEDLLRAALGLLFSPCLQMAVVGKSANIKQRQTHGEASR